MADGASAPTGGSLPARLSASLDALRAHTPARVFRGRAGPAYSSQIQLELRQDHAFALDAVHAELDLERDFDPELLAGFRLFEVATRASSKEEYLRRPDLGRRLSEKARQQIGEHCPRGATLQVIIGDGLSSTATARQVPRLLPGLRDAACKRGWAFGQPLVIRHCRVGVLNDVGDLLDPEVVVLLIGERPGLATAESLSAYLAYRPRSGHTDAQRNLISNIHDRGVLPDDAVARVMALAERMRQLQASGTSVKEA